MTLQEFAKKSGVTTFNGCADGHGGDFGYTTKGAPNVHFCGYRTEKAALKAWAHETFGKHAATALIKLLENK